MATIELNFEMDPVERLTIEIEASESGNNRRIGEYLLDQFSHDEPLKQAYKVRKMTLDAIIKEIERCAKEKLNSKNGYVSDDEVYGWILHFVQDGKNTFIKDDANSYKISKLDEKEARARAIKKFEADELERLKQEEEEKKKKLDIKIARDKKKNEENGQLSLFDLQ